jgi:SNF2 family DNA or RNA helicase
MRRPSDLFPYQKKAVNFQCSHPASALWLDMGLGKSVITLTSVAHLLDSGYLKAVIIVAPVRVCKLVWRQEAMKWSHTQHLKFAMMTGEKQQREFQLLQRDRQIFLINYENLGWLAEALQTHYIAKKRPVPFDGIVFDEISKCKNSATKRVHALLKVLPQFKWRTGLTGTPASNGYKDLHGQYLVLDDGKRLGTSKTAFHSKYYFKRGMKEVAFEDTENTIKTLIADITIEMSAADYNPLPDMIFNDVLVELPSDLRAKYEQLEQELFMKLDSGVEIEVFNQASLTNKCLQFSNGAVYPEPGMPAWEHVHDLKLEALEDILEESAGQPVLCSYAYRSDAERIMRHFKDKRPINLTECKSEKQLVEAMRRWTTGDCQLMIGHPASMGHGIDGLQQHGHTLVWFGLTWSLDLMDQFNARIRRQGQGVPVICHRILCGETLDQAQLLAMEGKAQTQAALRKAVKEYREQKEKN